MIQSKSSKFFALIIIALIAVSAVISGCATPEEGSSMPWNRPDAVQDGSFFGIATY